MQVMISNLKLMLQRIFNDLTTVRLNYIVSYFHAFQISLVEIDLKKLSNVYPEYLLLEGETLNSPHLWDSNVSKHRYSQEKQSLRFELNRYFI